MTGLQHLLTHDEVDSIRKAERSRGRREMVGKIQLFVRDRKMVGVKKLLDHLAAGDESMKDMILSYLDRDAMADNLAEHFIMSSGECQCGGWAPGDKARDYLGHVVDQMLERG